MRSWMMNSEATVQTARRLVSRGGIFCFGLAITAACLGLQCPGTTPCAADADCDNDMFCDGAETCDTESMTCVDGTAPCGQDEICVEADDACVECAGDMDCATGETCVDGACVPGMADPCEGVTCGTCEECVDGACVAFEGAIANGEAFYMANGCANCHGANANDGFAPDITGTDCATLFDKLSGAVGHAGGMVAGVTGQDTADLAAWLGSL